MNITKFLSARYDEEARTAEQCGRHRWQIEMTTDGAPTIVTDGLGWETTSWMWSCDDPECDCLEYRRLATAEATHIAAHNPAAVLADVTARRRILDLHRPTVIQVHDWDDGAELTVCDTCGSGPDDDYPAEYPCATVLALAEPYRRHPDYTGVDW